MKISRLSAILLVVTAVSLFGCSSEEPPTGDPEMRLETLQGEVRFGARGSLPAGASLAVELVDITDGLDEPIVLSAVETADRQQSPYKYSLVYDPSVIQAGRDYRVRAQIRWVDGKVDNSAGMLDPFAGSPATFTFFQEGSIARTGYLPTISLQGFTWILDEIGGEPVDLPLDARPHLMVDAESDGYSGFAGCNRFTGRYDLDGTSLSLGNAVATRKACQERMEIEARFLQLLSSVKSWRLEGQQMLLGDQERNVLARFILEDE